MSWNINISLLTGTMLCILFGYYLAYPRLPVALNGRFIAVAVSEMLTLVFDIVSSLVDMNYQSFPTWALYLVNMLYFVFFVLRDYSMYTYTATLVSSRKRVPRGYLLVGRILLAAFLLISLSSFFTGAVFFIDETGYHEGPLYAVTHIQIFLFLILNLLLLVRYRSEISNAFFYGMELVFGLLIAGAVLRYLFPEYLLLDTIYMIVVMILYIVIHNAALFRESRTMSFDYQAFEMLVRERHNYGIWYQLIGIMPVNYDEMRQIYGGAPMDRALSQIGKYLKDAFRCGTVFYERSGCFLVLIDGRQASEKAISQILPEVIRRFREPWDGGEEARVYMTCVFGQMNSDLELPSIDLELETVRKLLEKGGSGELDHDFVVDRAMVDEISREFAVKKALSDALNKNEIRVYLQPIIEASTGKVAGAEALSRIIDPKLGLIPPGEFIPMAEHSGSIIQIGEQVLAKTCSFLVDHPDLMQKLNFININLSPIQCMDLDIVDTFELVPQTYGVDPKMLHLEITEESMVDPEVLKNQMEQLGLLGYVFALDDYGSGYANQFRIKTFPFSGIKLDMKIVWAHFREPDTILPNAVRSFLDRGLSVTAEGVETEEMAQQLIQMGCTFLQGFHYSKPLPPEEFVEYVREKEAQS